MTTDLSIEMAPRRRPRAPGRVTFWRALTADGGALLGAGIVCLFILVGMFAPRLSPYDPLASHLPNSLQKPSLRHPLGFDEFGRDILSRVMHGSRISLLIALGATGSACILGVSIGLAAGYRGSWVENVALRLTDVMLAFPGILMALAIIAVLGRGTGNVMVAIGIYFTPFYVRLVRGLVLSVKERDYVEAARGVGATDLRILYRHIVPNILGPVIVQTTLNIGAAILITSSLSFLGLGVQPPTPEWGVMLANGRTYLRVAPHVATFPGLAIMLVVLGFNLLGDGLRDALDPTLRGQRGT
ncbi:MAG: ABC transporter permease [Armatimonadetes bacterium]|nr:ABC transporter permease [Armatimonadota bacterium]